MAKMKTAFFCNECGYDSAKWFGMCPVCKAAGTAVEEKIDARPVVKTSAGISSGSDNKPVVLKEVSLEEEDRIQIKIDELDRVLGGGIIPGSVVLIAGDAELSELLFVLVLMGVHDLLKDYIVQKRGGDVPVDGSGVRGEFLSLGEAGRDKLIVQLVHGLDGLQAERNNGMAVFACDGNHALCAEGFAVHDEGLDDLCHGLALCAVEQCLLFGCKIQKTTSLYNICK